MSERKKFYRPVLQEIDFTEGQGVAYGDYIVSNDREMTVGPVSGRVHLSHGGASLTILGDVYDGAEVYCGGGAAVINVYGVVHDGALVWCEGGGAEIRVHMPSPHARLYVRGGGVLASVCDSRVASHYTDGEFTDYSMYDDNWQG